LLFIYLYNRLSCLELQHSFLSGEQLYNEVYNHYSSQAIKQLYVLVLGLDVLGNPYGLAMGVASGVEAFFYEPIQVFLNFNLKI
jgi:vacuolar protein sorting-associated protein 13A/C